MLSKLKTVADTIGNSTDGIARIELPREVFEEAIAPLLTRAVMLVEQALDSIGLEPREIDHVVLVGGSTRIPKVREVLERKFGFEPKTCGNVDECVALGAALFAARGQPGHRGLQPWLRDTRVDRGSRTPEKREWATPW